MKPMTEEKVDKVRKRFIAFVFIIPLLFCGFLMFTLWPRPTAYAGLPAVSKLLSAETGEASEFEKDPVTTRKKILDWVKLAPKDGRTLHLFLADSELNRIAKMPLSKQPSEAKVALKAQLELFDVMDNADLGFPFNVFGMKPSDEPSFKSVLDIAVVAKESDFIRKEATKWANGSGPFSMTSKFQLEDAQTYFGWAAWIDRDYDQASVHLIASADHIDDDIFREYGPGTKLANELLKVGKFDEVATWVEKVGTFWKPEITKGWLKTILAKKIPADEAWKDQFPF
jgi:hypothetical protein